LSHFAGSGRALLCALALSSGGCGKFQQARECGTFVKTVNAWLASTGAQTDEDAGASSDPKQVATQARRTAEHYAELSQRLAALHVQSEDLAPRVQRYEAIADSAARTLREVAEALDHGDLEKARQKRVDFDTVAQREPLLVKEINGLCR
jgi:acyl-CoA reductase-like NAD-dependent aldehyde dehydrogenase